MPIYTETDRHSPITRITPLARPQRIRSNSNVDFGVKRFDRKEDGGPMFMVYATDVVNPQQAISGVDFPLTRAGYEKANNYLRSWGVYDVEIVAPRGYRGYVRGRKAMRE